MEKNLFFSTRTLNGPYNYIVRSSKKNFEDKCQKKLDFYFFKIEKFLSIDIYYFFILNILKIFFKKNFLDLKYKNLDLSIHVLSQTYKNQLSYKNNFYFYINFIVSFYHACKILNSLNKVPRNIDAAYIDHGMYINGVIFQFFFKKKIVVYSNNLPKGLFKLKNNKKNRNFIYGDFLKFQTVYNLNKNQKNKSIQSLKKIIYQGKIFHWLKKTKYKKSNKKYLNYTHVIYAHSFTDAQLIYGYDGFLNMKDWLIFTLEELLKNKKNKILLKAHPNFYNKSMGQESLIDKIVFDSVKKKFSHFTNLTILDKPIKNFELLKKINKKSILISHHSNALLEDIYFGFKCISSSKTFWDSSKLNLTNTWFESCDYSILLKKKWNYLKFSEPKHFYSVLYDFLVNDYHIGGKKYFWTLVNKILKVKNSNKAYNIQKYGRFSKPKSNIFKKIIKKLSHNIEEV